MRMGKPIHEIYVVMIFAACRVLQGYDIHGRRGKWLIRKAFVKGRIFWCIHAFYKAPILPLGWLREPIKADEYMNEPMPVN